MAGLSVVIATLDRPAELRRLTDSLATQSVAAQLVVMDDAVERLGSIVQRNRGIERADGPIVVQFDDDVVLPSPRTLEQTLADFDHPRIGAVAIPYVNVRRDAVVRHEPPDAERPYVAGAFVGCAVAYRRAAFLGVGGYDEDLVDRGEEGDLVLRMLDAGWFVRLGRADPVEHHEVSPAKRPATHFHSARSDLLSACKRVPAPALPGRVAAASVRSLLVGARRGELGAAARGVAAGLAAGWSHRSDRAAVRPAAYALARRLRRHGPLGLEEAMRLA